MTVDPIDIEAIYPLSPMQQGLVFHSLLAPGSGVYVLQYYCGIHGPLDDETFRQAWAIVVARHAVLRTLFVLDHGDKPLQVVLKSASLPWEALDWSSLPTAEQAARLQDRLKADRTSGFDLAAAPLFRLMLIKTGPQTHQLVWSVHHAVVDGWTISQVLREVFASYEALGRGDTPKLPAVRPYADYIGWLDQQDHERAEQFWRRAMAGLEAPTALPVDAEPVDPSSASDLSDKLHFSLSKAETASLQQMARRQQLTLNTVVQGAWALLLARWSGDEDVVFGATVSGRPASLAGSDAMVGLFINTLPVRARLVPNMPVGEWLRGLQRQQAESREYEYSSLVEIQRWSDVPRGQTLFDTLLLFESFPSLRSATSSGAPISVGEMNCFDATHYLVTLAIGPGEQLGMRLIYDGRRIDASTIERMARQFKALLLAVAQAPERPVKDVSPLSEDDRRQMLVDWNATDASYPRDRAIHQLFEAQADRERVAVEVEDGSTVSYRELNSRANRLAHHLITLGVGPDVLVGICMERSAAMLVALLGVLKAGGTYVPLDPAYPRDRLAFMIGDAQVRVLLTEKALADLVPAAGAATVFLDRDTRFLDGYPDTNPGVRLSPENLAYVIYTSGSTGRPKGVQVPHGALTNFLCSMQAEPGLDEHDVLLSVTTLSFDIAGLELYLPLICGARLVLVSRETAANASRLAARLASSKPTVMQATPATWRMLIGAGWTGSPSLKMLCGGEALPRDLAAAMASRGSRVWNLYGPTETTVWSTARVVKSADRTIPIGRPIANTQTYVLDPHGLPVPVGAPGELYIGGAGVARGYLKRPELTAERFVPDPFGAAPGARLYRTGDLVRYNAGGELEYLGRLDHQVKLRGFRIELGEIEAVVAQSVDVRQAVVIIREDVAGDPRIVAYVVPVDGKQPNPVSLRQHAADKLPQYMVPSAFVVLASLPLTPNGKIDRKALPAPDGARQVERDLLAPRTALERRIAAVWQDVLRVREVGVRDNFFELGGHSLLLMQVHTRLSATIEQPVALIDLFQYPTIEALARHLDGDRPRADLVGDAHERAARRFAAGDEAIAVVGMAGRFPGAPSPEAFWTSLREGRDAITFFSDEELRAAGVPERVVTAPGYVKARGVLEGTELFDAWFFKYTPREATLMDPQQRLLLECAWEALERAGYDPESYPGFIGVFAGSSINTYLPYLLARQSVDDLAGTELLLTADKDHLATRVSYKLNLRGPAITVQTACSTSLVAVHLACQSLLNHECDMALAGGVSALAPAVAGYMYHQGGIGSIDGRCRPFDASANGTLTGCGVGLVVLKRLSQALEDGDVIEAVIRGSAVTNDGSGKVGYTAPGVDGQARAIALAQAAARCAPETITYIEAHGTGTAMGDPIEMRALTQAFAGAALAPGSCAIGSVKSNIGHLDAAAGVAGLIKTVLALEHRELPPTLHFERPNPELEIETTPFYVNTSLRAWETPEGTLRRAGVSSFGLGGTNVHAVLEEAPAVAPSGPGRPWQLLTVSARTRAALDAATARLADFLEVRPAISLADVAYTLQIGRQAFRHRRAVLARTVEEAVSTLRKPQVARVFNGEPSAAPESIVFMFPGQGAQHVDMARDLYRDEPVFRRVFDECVEKLEPRLGVDLRSLVFPPAADSTDAAGRLTETSVAQPALFAVEYALAALWRSWGVEPSALVGHSIGELVAACLAGVFSLDDALALVAARGALMQSMPAGAMLAVPLPEAQLQTVLDDHVSLAAVNGPSLCVVGGSLEHIEALEQRLLRDNVPARRLHTSHAFHSRSMDPIVGRFVDLVRGVSLKPPSIPFVSNLTGAWITDAEATDPSYWGRHLRQPVRFSDGIARILTGSRGALLEVGPGRTLTALARMHPDATSNWQIVPSSRQAQHDDGEASFAGAAGQLWADGQTIDWRRAHEGERRLRVILPTYPFERERFWVDGGPLAAAGGEAPAERAALSDWFSVPGWMRSPRPSGRAAEARSRWLVFADRAGVADRAVNHLTASGREVVVVESGDGYRELRPGRYAIDAANREHYRALFTSLAGSGRLPDVVAHFWGVTPSTPEDEDASASDECLRLGFYSVLFLAQALGELAVNRAVRLGVVTTGLHDVVGAEATSPSKAAVLGPCRVIPAEYASVTCCAIDIQAVQAAALSTPGDGAWESVLAELESAVTDPVVAYREGERWTPTLEAVGFEPAAAGEHPRLRDRGVYLITGGFGGIGLTLADYLARTVSATVVLVGRTGLPDRAGWAAHIAAAGDEDRTSRQIRAVEAIERSGGRVVVVTGDIADAPRVKAIVSETRERLGRLDGIIHAAGVAGGGVIQMKTAGAAAKVLAPKLAGARALADATEGIALDFFVLCSSTASLVGGAGQVDYCAANAFLDAFARSYMRRTGTFTVAVNWDTWRRVGMAYESVVPGALASHRAAALLRGIEPDEGAEAFARILAHGTATQVVVSTRRAASASSGAGRVLARHARPEIATDYNAPSDEIEQTIANVWQGLLGIDGIGRDDNFFDLGGHSLLLVQMHAKLVERLRREVPVTDLFRFPTIATLSAHIGGRADAPVNIGRRADAAAGRHGATDAVAIIGMSGRFAGAANLDAFWANLRDGVESIEPVGDDELERRGIDRQLLKDPRYVKVASAVADIELFDAGFFGYAPREAELMDPQHRLFLECAWEALERSGYDPKRYDGSIGVYAGSSLNAYLNNVFANPELVREAGTLQAVMGNRGDFLPTRVSYKLNLRGPSVNVQTACSTSLVAVHQACRSLIDRECDMALAGGATIAVPARTGYLYAEQNILAPDGHCRAFDAQAQGTVWGDGVGVVVLKRLSDAIADGDAILAVVRGTAINNDGAVKVGYTAPSVEGQAEVVARAHAAAGVVAADVSLIEAHGTGTALGDPIEIAALGRAFGEAAPNTCAIGSLKTNLGHLDAAAGVAGLIKTVLALQHRLIPPSLHFETPNPQINFAATPFFVNTVLTPWESGGRKRIAGVSSFGMGGTNAHAIVEEAPEPSPAGPSRDWQILTLSARSDAALDAATDRLAAHLERHPDEALADVAYTLHVGRQAFDRRRAVICRDVEGAVQALRTRTPRRCITAVAARVVEIVFMFPGQGSQHAGMGRGLYESEARFREVIDECARRLTPLLGVDIRTLMCAPSDDAGAAARLNATAVAQPALFAFELALARLWMSWGIVPTACIGHSVGEFVAAHLAGVWSLDEALGLVAERGRLMQTTEPGAMLAVSLSATALEPLLGTLSLAAANGPSLSVASGPDAEIARLEQELARRDVEARRLHTSHAFHSSLMDPVVAAFRAAVARTTRNAPTMPFMSNVTGAWIRPEEACDPDYWTRHLRGTVRFDDGLASVARTAPAVLLEVGPGRTLTSLAQQHPGAVGKTVVASARHPLDQEHDQVHLLLALGRLWTAGVALDWAQFGAGEDRQRRPLPTYPFERQRYWLEGRRGAAPRSTSVRKRDDVAEWFYLPTWKPALRPRPDGNGGRLTRDGWIVFLDAHGVGEELVRRLRERAADVATVTAGSRFVELEAGNFVIDPTSAADYSKLIAVLAGHGRRPRRVIHLWSLTADDEASAAIDPSVTRSRGLMSLFRLAPPMASAAGEEDASLTVVTSHALATGWHDRVVPEKATAIGPVLVIPQESPSLRCALVDANVPRSERDRRQLAEALMAEVLGEGGDPFVACRGSQRLVLDFAQARIETPETTRLRERGVYVITGGLGNIGLAIAAQLARRCRARLALITRTGLPPREQWNDAHDAATAGRIAAVRELQELGSEVLVLSADVADESRLRAAFGEVEERLGPVHGVIHAAGVLSGASIALIEKIGPAEVAEQFHSKVDGLYALERVLEGRGVEFCLLTSSLSCVLGGLAYGAYAAANAFQDAFATDRNRRGDCEWIAVNWDIWDFGPVDGPKHGLAEFSMRPDEAGDVFARVMGTGAPQHVVISTGDLAARYERYVLKPTAGKAAASDGLERHSRPATLEHYAPPADDVETLLVEVWQDLLGIDPVGRFDNFFELGGHSLLATRVVARVKQRLGVDLPLRAFFEAPSLAELAERVSALKWAAGRPASGAVVGVGDREEIEI